MELTWDEWKAMKKQLRRKLGMPGWTLLIYYGMMNVSVFLWTILDAFVRAWDQLRYNDFTAMEGALHQAMESGWGYFPPAIVGLVILLLWKKPKFWKEQIWARGKPMEAGKFFEILCVFLGMQFLSQISLGLLEVVLNAFDLTILEGVEALSVSTDTLSMFLYAGILAPITEELLFRGLIQRSMMPYGRNFAIFVSALTFGLFHGNLVQSPFAFLVGLVLGYVAAEYSIAWAMLLHMINNLLLADAMNRLTAGLPQEVAGMVIGGILLFLAVAGAVVLLRRKECVRSWMRREPIHRTYLGCFFSSGGTIVFLLVMGAMMVFTMLAMITPL